MDPLYPDTLPASKLMSQTAQQQIQREIKVLQAVLAIDTVPTATSAGPRVRTAGDSRGTHPSHVADYKERIDDLVAAAARDGYHTVVLAGESDLAFLVEHACIHEGLTFLREPKQDKQNNKVDVSSRAPERPHGAVRLIGEAASGTDAETTGDAWLWRVIQGQEPGGAYYE